jgi:hypothetical protein
MKLRIMEDYDYLNGRSMEKKNYYRILTCNYCGNISHMITLGQFSDDDEYDDSEWGRYSDGSGTTYVGLKCHACSRVNIISYYWHPGMEDSNEDVQIEFLYPLNKDYPKGLPPSILNAYISAEKVKAYDPHLYAVAIGRLLELVCNDKGAKKHNKLEYRLRDLYTKGEIPLQLVDIADGIKDFRNIGAHAGLVELTDADIPLVDNLCTALLEYLYSAPYLARQAEKSLEKIRAKAAASKRKK